MIRSIVTAVDLKASSQIAGMISSLQGSLARINSPEMCYVLSGDEFDLDINHPASPKNPLHWQQSYTFGYLCSSHRLPGSRCHQADEPAGKAAQLLSA
jgi:hypothetical protein